MTTRTSFLILSCIAAALSACSGEPQPDAAPEPAASTTSSQAPESEQPVDAAEPVAQTIPAALHGRWGMVPGDCSPERGDAKGMLTVDATTLRFYESAATLEAVKSSSGTGIRATFAFTGEGMAWRRDEELTLEDGGRALVRREFGSEASPGPFRYARC